MNIYQEHKFLTKDIGGNTSTSEFTERLCDEISKLDNKNIVWINYLFRIKLIWVVILADWSCSEMSFSHFSFF